MILLIPLAAGCIGRRGNIELLEARLREHQDLLERQRRNLSDTQAQLSVARREADLLREQMAGAGTSPLPPEYTASLFRVEEIRFNSLMTGGRDRDGVPGDEQLVVVFAPHDEHGDLVKLPGTIELEAIDLTRTEEEGRQVAHWVFSPEESRDLWRSALFSAGYELRLEWPEPPTSGDLLLHARLSTADGRRFDASHTIAIVPPAVDSVLPEVFPAPEVIQPVSFESVVPQRDIAAEPRPSPAWYDIIPSQEGDSEMADPADTRGRDRPDQEPVLSTDATADNPDTVADQDVEARADGTGEARRTDAEELRTSDVWTDETIPRLR